MARYDGLAAEYDEFVDRCSPYYAVAAGALERLLGPGSGRGWQVVGVDASEDQLRVARERHADVELVLADAAAPPFPDRSFDSAFSTLALAVRRP